MKTLPTTEILWLTSTSSKGIYYITSNTSRETYFLYEQNKGNEVTKIMKSKDLGKIRNRITDLEEGIMHKS